MPARASSDTFPALTVIRYLKRGRVYQNSHLSGCAPADQFCAGSVVPAGGGTGQRPAVQRRAGSLRGGGGCGFLAGAAGPHSAVERRAALQGRHRGAGRGRGLWLAGVAGFCAAAGVVLAAQPDAHRGGAAARGPDGGEQPQRLSAAFAGGAAGERRLCVRRADVGPPPAGGRKKRPVFRQSWR